MFNLVSLPLKSLPIIKTTSYQKELWTVIFNWCLLFFKDIETQKEFVFPKKLLLCWLKIIRIQSLILILPNTITFMDSWSLRFFHTKTTFQIIYIWINVHCFAALQVQSKDITKKPKQKIQE